jgi:hypothetical protein
MADHYLSILSFFSFGHCAVLLIAVCLFCPFFPLAIVLYNSDQQYSTMAKGKEGQNRQTEISHTAQWPKEKKNKIDK